MSLPRRVFISGSTNNANIVYTVYALPMQMLMSVLTTMEAVNTRAPTLEDRTSARAMMAIFYKLMGRAVEQHLQVSILHS